MGAQGRPNVAARLCGLAKAGEVLATAELTHLARRIEGVKYAVAHRPRSARRRGPGGERTISWLPGALGRRPRTTAAVACLVSAAVVAAVLLATNGGSNNRPVLSALGENSVGIVDPDTGALLAQVGVGAGPKAAASGYGSVWTADTDANTVSRVDVARHAVTQRSRSARRRPRSPSDSARCG